MWVWMVKKGSKVAKVWALEGVWVEKVSPKWVIWRLKLPKVGLERGGDRRNDQKEVGNGKMVGLERRLRLREGW
jgi:hypothetical protein